VVVEETASSLLVAARLSPSASIRLCKVGPALPPRKQKRHKQKLAAASQRRPDIREQIESYIQSLLQLYENTDPARGAASEENKLEFARQAISIWWYLYGELLLWAQSQIAGYEFGRSNPDFMEKLSKTLGHEITVDSHILEYIGLGWSWNHVNYDDPMVEWIDEELGKSKANMDERAIRSLIRELLTSRSANSSFWRFELQSALYALGIGHVDEIFKPEPIRKQGDALQLFDCKLMALRHVHFHIGKGMKKYRALQLVADELGQSVETLRSWEKSISGDDELMIELGWSSLAGGLEGDLDKHSIHELIKMHGAKYHRHTADIEYAKSTLGLIRSRPLKGIRDDLRRGRLAKKSGK
jgi:hypothetical protein